MLRQFIKVQGQYDGFHKYENAPEQVAFLRNSHRHLFKWEAVIEVFHEDRELEFFMVQQTINQHILPHVQIHKGGDLGSCENQAKYIIKGIIEAYGEDRYIIVEVSEDGENAGIVEWIGKQNTNR